MTFRFAAKYGLLTYSQSDGLDPFRIVDVLAELGAECIVGKELHSDGGTHYHAFFMFDRKFQSRNPRIFDVDGRHPNILRGRKTPHQMYDYATKDGDVVAGGLQRPDDDVSTKTDSDEFWRRVFDAETREETFRVAQESSVSLLGRYFFQVRAIAEGKAVQSPLDFVSPPELEWELGPYPELTDWCSTYLGRRGGRYVLSLRPSAFATGIIDSLSNAFATQCSVTLGPIALRSLGPLFGVYAMLLSHHLVICLVSNY